MIPLFRAGAIGEMVRALIRLTSAAMYAGMAKFFLGGDAEAIVWFRRSLQFNPNYSLAHFLLAATLSQLGKPDEAHAEATAGVALDPTFSIRRYRASASSDEATYLAGRERAIEGLRKAGVPEA